MNFTYIPMYVVARPCTDTIYGMGEPQMTNHQGQLAFTITQFCDAVGISRRTLYTLWERNQGPPRVAVGKRVLIPRQGGEAWLRDRPAA